MNLCEVVVICLSVDDRQFVGFQEAAVDAVASEKHEDFSSGHIRYGYWS
jgi:hypothetical protein